MRLIEINSAEDLRARAGAWDDLWHRSATAWPTARAEVVAAWLDHFAPGSRLRALAVEDAGQWVAALPLYGRRLKGMVEIGDLPNNPWSASGDLLLDATCDAAEALAPLAAGVSKLPWPMLWMEGVACEAQHWRAFMNAAGQEGLSLNRHDLHRVGVIDADADWERYCGRLDGDFRRNVRRCIRGLEKQGRLELRVVEEFPAGEVDALLQRALEVEDRSWKGPAGTAVLRHPGMPEFFRRQARLLAGWGQLACHFLEIDGEPVAFELGYQTQGVFFAHKVSYDQQYAKQGPGHVLRWLQLPVLFARHGFQQYDFFGRMTDAMQRWTTGGYTVSRLVVAPRRLFSRAIMGLYTSLWPKMRRARERLNA